ncbi:MAG: DUF6920 family protein [Desulfohalobiaceae bacterium]
MPTGRKRKWRPAHRGLSPGGVPGVFTSARFGRFDGEYRQVPWEGHFCEYQSRAGMRIPLYGEVGWHTNGTLRLVWKGTITDAGYEFGR